MRSTVFIIVIAVAFVIYYYGKEVVQNIRHNIAQKEQLELVAKKLDSIYLENRNIVRKLSDEKDSVYLIIRENVLIMDTIYTKAINYEVPEESDEILKELRKFTQ